MDTTRKEPFVSFTLQLRRDARAAIQRIADERDINASDVVREAVRDFLVADAARRQLEPVAA